MKLVATIVLSFRAAYRILLQRILKHKFARCGKNVKFDPFGSYSFDTIEIGNDVFIGTGAVLLASASKIVFGNKIMLGPNVTMMGGDHNTVVVGKYMFDVKQKIPGNDLPIIVKDDVWIGTGAIILKGVTIGEGSIVAAGALVNRDVPSYAIVAGIPAKVVKLRFTEEEISRHKLLLGLK